MTPTSPPGSAPTPGRKSAYTGRTIARCLVGEKLGRGATSHVFKARHEGLGKDVALKILSAEAAGSEEMRRRFLSEARVVAKLSHENIVKVYDAVEDQGLLCILMELVQGGTLQDRLDDGGALEPRIAFRIAAQIARALEAAHEVGLVHRDVKPANVMLTGRAGEEEVRVVDFGLAVQAEMNRVGTPMFMSPEAAQGKRIDEKSDVYALGVCLYNMLTGVLPFTGASVKEILAAQVNMEAVAPSVRHHVLGTQFDDVVKKLLVKSKGYRPTAAEAADLLEDIADELDERAAGVQAIRRRKKRPKKKVAKKSNAMLWVGLAVALVLIVMIFYLATSGTKAPPPPTDTGGVTTDPGVRPAAHQVDPAQKDYDEVEAWYRDHADNPAEAARRYAAVEQHWPGTPWATKAAIARGGAESAARLKDEKDKRDEENRRKTEAERNDPAVKYKRFNELLSDFRFADAASLMDQLPPPDGTADAEWSRRLNRLEFLAKTFVDRFDRGLSQTREAGKPVKASDLVAAAKDGDIVVSARSQGLIVEDPSRTQRTVPWREVKREGFFLQRVIVDRVLRTTESDECLVLACLAMELGQPEKKARDYLEMGLSSIDDEEQRNYRRSQLFQ